MQKIPLSRLNKPAATPPPTRWQAFSAMPHNMMFAIGFVHLLLALLWWSAELIGRYLAWWPPLPSTIFSTWAHAFLLIYGVFPLFIFGFLLTVYPRWMNTPVVPRRLYVTAFFLLATGLLLIHLGLLLAAPLLSLGLGVFLLGWSVVLYALLSAYLLAKVEDTRYETLFNTALVAGWIGVFLYAWVSVTSQWMLLHYAIQIGLWLFLVPITLGVAHRMVPFFTSSVMPDYLVYRPTWVLWLLPLCAAGHAISASLTAWSWRLAFDLPLLISALYLSYRWQFFRALRAEPLAAVLHVAFLWFSIAMSLFTLQSAWLLINGEMILGKAPLHALVLGFMSTLLVAMVSRVTLGHSGRVPRADRFTLMCFWGVFAVAILRLSGEFWPLMNLVAAAGGVLVFGLWVGRYLPMVLSRRVDWQP